MQLAVLALLAVLVALALVAVWANYNEADMSPVQQWWWAVTAFFKVGD